MHPQDLIEKAEKSLYAALIEAEAAMQQRDENSPDSFLTTFFPMIPAVNTFFDEVLVMAESTDQRQNRLALLQRIVALGSGIADMSRLEGF